MEITKSSKNGGKGKDLKENEVMYDLSCFLLCGINTHEKARLALFYNVSKSPKWPRILTFLKSKRVSQKFLPISPTKTLRNTS